MKSKFAVLAILLLIFLALPAMGKLRCTPIYIFGTSASFNDSIVYLTEIQIIDSAWVDDKGLMLVKRSDYSSQLRDYLVGRGESNRTCLVSFSLKEKDIMKKYQKMKKQFNGTKKKSKKYDLREIDDEEFRFDAVSPDESDMKGATIDKKAAHRVEKSKAKKQKGLLKDNPTPEKSGTPVEGPAMPPRH